MYFKNKSTAQRTEDFYSVVLPGCTEINQPCKLAGEFPIELPEVTGGLVQPGCTDRIFPHLTILSIGKLAGEVNEFHVRPKYTNAFCKLARDSRKYLVTNCRLSIAF